MDVRETQLLREVLRFLADYQNPGIRDEINQKMVSGEPHKGHPVFFYIQHLLIFSPVYRRYYTRFTKTSFLKRASRFMFRKSPAGTEQMEDFLRYCYNEGRQEYQKLQNLTAPPGILSSSDIQTGQQISNLPDGPQKNFILSQYLAKLARSKSAPVVPYHGTPPPKKLTSKQINVELKKYQEVSGKEIRYVPKIHPPLPEPEAVKKLDKLVGIEPEVRQPLVSVGGEILSKVKDVAVQVEIPTQRVTSRVGPALLSMGGNILKTALGGGGKLALGLGGKGLGLIAGAATGPVGWAALGASLAGKPVKKLARQAMIAGAAFVVFIFLLITMRLFETTSLLPPPGVGEAAPLPGTTPGPIPGGGCPDTSNNRDGFSCRYLNPSVDLFDTNISPAAVESYISKYKGVFIEKYKYSFSEKDGPEQEFKDRVNYIITKSKEGKLNPALFLGYWKTESAFSTIGTRDMGCAGDGFEEQVRCALGIEDHSNLRGNPIANCARGNQIACDALREIRAKSGFDLTHPINYPIKTVDDFAEAYGPYDHLSGGLPTNCTHTYNGLIDVMKELGACTVSPTSSPVVTASSCPLPEGKASCGSLETPRNGCGHCGTGYPTWATNLYCGYPGTKFAVDIDLIDTQVSEAGKEVFLPSVDGKVIQWEWYFEEGKGSQAIQAYTGIELVSRKVYFLQLHHTEPGSGNKGIRSSGEVGGKICLAGCDHVHIQLGDSKVGPGNTNWLDAAKYFCTP